VPVPIGYQAGIRYPRYNYTPLLGMNLDCSTALIYPVNVLISH
jgi:hypothetical protein